MTKILCIAIGGAAGSLLRYFLGGIVQRSWDGWQGWFFPAGTLLINVTGCLVIGMLAALFSGPVALREEYRVGLMVGLLGGFTTFSSFGLETFHLLSDGQRLAAAANVVLSCGLGIAAVMVGYWVAERMLSA
ncbi:MAG: fluoride efflux transporter CrcB [Planctomycetaceae bacterium]|nr:fluoride efflux transporter CrcB [Planctomycetaceae bacterium]